MNRRAFLAGIFGAAAVAAAGPKLALLETTAFDEVAWAEYISNLVSDQIADMVIYGTSATEYIDHYPWVRRVPPCADLQDAFG